MAFISLFHKNFKKGYIYKNVNIITLIIDDFIVLLAQSLILCDR